MKKILLLLFTSLAIINIQAQEGKWQVSINKKTILSTSKEDEVKNVKTVLAKEWKKNGFLELTFTEASAKEIWYHRHFMIVDKDENDFYRLDSTNKVKISLSDLRKKAAGKKEIFIYTSISPKDPTVAIRIRRVHLITLKIP